MFFTQEDYKKIEAWLYKRTVKDTDFPIANPINGSEAIPIIQDNKNRVIGFNDFVKQVAFSRPSDFYNVNAEHCKSLVTLEEAVSLVPYYQRKKGLVITFCNEHGNWLIYQFAGKSINQWDSLHYWENIIEQALKELIFWPDEEDITFVQDGNRKFLKFRNREYNPEDFLGMGMTILRRNYEGTEACAIDDEDHMINLLTQEMINQPNTVYVIEYDFDLNGNTIAIPDNCVLWFQGGTINNGSIYLKETAILGAFEFADMGDAELFGTFNTGQIMTFSNDSYKEKSAGYFTSDTLNKEEETFTPAPINPDAYTTSTRQELRWWNGEEWIPILDITDYIELKSIISELIDKHNKELSSVFVYFRDRCRALEKRMTEAEHRLDEHDVTLQNHETRISSAETDIRNIKGDITNINRNITNIEGNISNIEGNITNIENNITDISGGIQNIENTIKQIQKFVESFEEFQSSIEETILQEINKYLNNNVLGATSVSVNGSSYPVDNKGVITIPDYPDISGIGGNAPSADKVNHKLTFTGAATGEFDGSEDVTINIPEGGTGNGDGGTADKVKNKLIFNGAVIAEYDGSSQVTVTIPTAGQAAPSQALTIKQGETELGQYNGSEAKTITIPEFPDKVANADIASKVSNKLKFTGAVEKEYDGSEEVTVDIPTQKSNETLIIKQGNTTLGDYDGSEGKTIVITDYLDMIKALEERIKKLEDNSNSGGTDEPGEDTDRPLGTLTATLRFDMRNLSINLPDSDVPVAIASGGPDESGSDGDGDDPEKLYYKIIAYWNDGGHKYKRTLDNKYWGDASKAITWVQKFYKTTTPDIYFVALSTEYNKFNLKAEYWITELGVHSDTISNWKKYDIPEIDDADDVTPSDSAEA